LTRVFTLGALLRVGVRPPAFRTRFFAVTFFAGDAFFFALAVFLAAAFLADVFFADVFFADDLFAGDFFLCFDRARLPETFLAFFLRDATRPSVPVGRRPRAL